MTWLGIDPAARQLPLSFEAAPKYAPRARATVRLRTAPGAWVSVAAVDEGILRLTSFVSPDPAPHFLGRRLLAVDIRDDWGRLIRPAEGDTTVLRQGGDDGRFVMPDIPQRTVSLFMPPVQAGADGTVEIPLDLPDFNGQVRLMAVGWSERKIGAVSTAIIVRDPLVAEPLLPRFLAPGDETRLTVLLHSLDQPAGESVAEISVDGPLMVSGPARLVAQLAPGARALPTTVLKATGAGRGVVRLDVTGTDGFKARREMPIWVRPVRGATTVVATTELPAGAEASVSPPAERFVAGTWQASATFGSAVRYDVAGLVASLDRYPLNCLEQAISRGLPLTALADGPIPGADRAGRLQQAIGLVLDRQRYDGGFALWTSGGSAEPWLSLYATEFLLRARAAGGTITEQTLVDAIRFISENGEHGNSEAAGLALQAYRFYVLALAGQGKPGAARVLMEQLGRLPTSLSKAHLGAALALAGDKARAELAFSEALKGFDRRWWDFDYGTSLRDQTAIAVLLKESTLLPDRLAKLGAILPGSDLSPDALNTQEQAWAAMAGAVLGRGMAAVRISVAGRDLSGQPPIGVAVTQAISVRNLGEKPVSQTLSATGVPSAPQVAARSQMRLTRKFFAMDGQVLDVDKVTQNTAFVLLLEGRAEDGQAHRVMIQHGLPAGWELAGRFPSGDVPGLAWLGKLTETESQVAADDRFAAVAALSANQPAFRVAVRVRAVTPGTYELPGGEVSDMYRPGIFARQNPGRIVVRGTE